MLPREVNLANLAATRAVLARFGFRPRHELGQNFLINPGIVDRMVAAAEIAPEEVVVEVGPGIGTLTRALAAAARQVLAVEVDARLLPILAFTLGAFGNVRVIQADVRRLSLGKLVQEGGASSFKLVANLPYYLTSAFLRQLLTGEPGCQLAVLTVQREVAQRLLASPGSKDYGVLTVAVAYFAEVKVVAQVGREGFWPRPEVASTVVRLVRRREPPVEVGDQALFFRVLRAAFAQRRKTLLNSLVGGLGWPKELVHKVLVDEGIAPARRAEDLSLAEFAALSRALGRRRREWLLWNTL